MSNILFPKQDVKSWGRKVGYYKHDPNADSGNPWRNLANAIVVQAVDDWMILCRLIADGTIDAAGRFIDPFAKNKPPFTFTSLRSFFKSDYCEMLCGNLDPSVVLAELEQRRRNAVKKTC